MGLAGTFFGGALAYVGSMALLLTVVADDIVACVLPVHNASMSRPGGFYFGYIVGLDGIRSLEGFAKFS